MNAARLSSENLHASTVACDGRAVLISGPSGSGKSDLALRLLDRGFTLVSDDRTIIRKEGERLIASAPETIKGKLEVRGVGIVDVEAVADVPIALVVELTCDIQRMPDDSRERLILGAGIPLVNVDAMTASAPSKVAMALDRLGLKF
ncbi:MAG TPA: HPr kinase/phosphatase C-terminal domain-containing protein [Sphingomicrobium sp.]|nr:HPr kinase/phosphatase C-terminal domain-containing protein [Sphingomicrobium sp.]